VGLEPWFVDIGRGLQRISNVRRGGGVSFDPGFGFELGWFEEYFGRVLSTGFLVRDVF